MHLFFYLTRRSNKKWLLYVVWSLNICLSVSQTRFNIDMNLCVRSRTDLVLVTIHHIQQFPSLCKDNSFCIFSLQTLRSFSAKVKKLRDVFLDFFLWKYNISAANLCLLLQQGHEACSHMIPQKQHQDPKMLHLNLTKKSKNVLKIVQFYFFISPPPPALKSL